MTHTRRLFSPSRPATLGVALGVLALAACGMPSRAEGETGGRAFSVSDAEPEVRSSRRGQTTIVLAQEHAKEQPREGEAPEAEAESELWLVILTLPEGFSPEPGETAKIGPAGSGLPSLKIAVGDLEVEDVDGDKVATTKNTEFVEAESGELTFWNVEKILAADFLAKLEGGGTVRGSFEARVP